MPFGIPTRHVRILCQALIFALWVALILATKHPLDSWFARHLPVSLFLRLDPLVMTVVSGGMRIGVTITLLGFATLAVSLLLGRVFCGWICPLGTLFDFYGWFLRRMNVAFEGPSPRWFTFKYYLLAATLLFALIGGVSPLMGLDPIVLLTRTAATVFQPLLVDRSLLHWMVTPTLPFREYLVDIFTLALFFGIITATTRLSRIWCRTACPLGAYLAVFSRNAMLQRDTKDCIHCNICAHHCPTGAINFENEEIYNESECIKCFSCTQECPVDANFFTYKSPFPTQTASKHPVSLERRTLLGTLIGTLATAPALRAFAGENRNSKTLLRPPMSREERDFLSSCIRCTECIKACPTGILNTAGFEHGLRAFWTPIMVPTKAPCDPKCHACSEACPTDAILKYPLEKKFAFKSGTAIFESTKCVSFTENKFCSECIRACPTNAIEFSNGWEPPGGLYKSKGADTPAPAGQIPTRPVRISFDKCVACGACEFECNKIVFGDPAMITTSYGRAVPTKLN